MKHFTISFLEQVCCNTLTDKIRKGGAALFSFMFVLWSGALFAQLSVSAYGETVVQYESEAAASFAELPSGYNSCFEIPTNDWEIESTFSAMGWTAAYNNTFNASPNGCTLSFWTGGYFFGGNNDNRMVSIGTTEVTVPANAGLLSFEYLSALLDVAGNDQLDYSYIKINGTTVFTKVHNEANNTNGYVDATIDVSAFAGQTITLEVGNVLTDNDNFQGNVVFACFEFLCSECTPSLSIACPADAVVECGSENNLELTGSPELSVEFCNSNDEVSVVYSDIEISLNNCTRLITRTWVATFGDLVETCTQTITVIDTTAPTISGVEPVVTVECLESVPGPAEASAVDVCSGNVDVTTFQSNTGEIISSCDLSTAFGPGPDWALWLPTLFELGYSASTQFNFVGDGSFDQYADGTAHLYGTIQNNLNPGQQFVVDFWFQNASTWSEWSAMGRSYKDDLGCAQPNHFQNWTYYEMVNNFSSMTGAGDYAGDVLYFTHMPSNYFFGLQVGQGANNKNCNFGLSAWFYFNGFMNGQSVNGIGDVNADAECEPVFEQDCIHNTSFTYLYRAQDACGRATIVSQEIVVEDTTAPEFISCPNAVTVECSDELPTVANPEAVDNCSGDVIVAYLGETTVEVSPCLTEVTRTWSATDVCGNRSFCTQLISVVDTTAPVFDSLPEALVTYECDNVVDAPVLTATDNCNEVNISYNEAITEGNCAGNYTITRTWVATDVCQNSSSFTQVVNVVDTTAPVFDEYPYYTSILCEDLPGMITAQDACGSVTVEVTFEELNSGGCLGVLHRIYTATDDCGNASTAEQFITIVDQTAPVIFNVGEEMTVECSDISTEGETIFGMGDVYSTDNCGGEVTLEYSEEIVATDDNCPQSYDVIRTWIATDYCENSSSASQLVHIVDTTAPEFIVYTAETNINCDEQLPAPFVTVADNCGIATWTSADVRIDGNCAYNYTIERTYTAIDECGNSTELTTYIFVSDVDAPAFAENSVAEISIECDQEVPYTEPSATDNCGVVTISHSDLTIESDPCFTLIQRTFTATDECGNANDFVQFIYINDTTAPEFNETAVEIERPCDDYAGVYTSATDNCNEVEITYTEELVSGSCAGRVIREYTATDVCGNASTFVQIITLIDEVEPVATFVPENQVVECGDEFVMADAQFSDNCDNELDVELSVEDVFDGCETVITYTWTATDHCFNETSVSATITIVDTTNPEWEFVPADLTIECSDEVPVVENAIAFDTCDENVEVAMTQDTLFTDCANNYTIRRIYRAFDNCGNEAMATQNIYVQDTTAPVIEGQSEVIVECGNDVPVIDPSTEDACGEVTLSYVDYSYEWALQNEISGLPTSIACPIVDVIVRQYTALDECGNSALFNQVIITRDITAPVVNQYAIEIEKPCDNYAGVFISATDECSEVSIDYSDEIVSGGCQGRVIRNYTIVDACGNTANAQQIITLTDATAPVVVEEPADITVQCSDENWSAAEVAFTDNCDDEVSIEFSIEYMPNGCLGYYLATWTAVDNCDNVTVVDQIITVIDTIDPEFDFVPESYTIECNEAVVLENALASDDCSNATVTVQEVNTPGDCPNTYTLVRIFTATDNCGNTATAEQVINVVDTTAPVWNFESAPSELSFECDEVVAGVEPTAMDNCNDFTIAVAETLYVEGPCYTSGAFIYTATDACGNVSAPFYQYFNVTDTTSPVIEGQVEIERPCDDYNGTYISATDNCNDLTIEFVDEMVSGGCQGRIIRSYEVADACGNISTFQQIITLSDSIDPTIAEMPENLIIECGEEVPAFIPEFSDNCDDELTIEAISGISMDGCEQVISRSWTATDNCGNSLTVSQEVRIVDTTAPEFTYVPASYTEQCGAELSFESATAFDVCDESVEVSIETVETPGSCAGEYTITRTFTATDACGNSNEAVQVITIVDEVAPEFTFVPESIEIACSEYNGIGMAVATDVCSDVEVSYEENSSEYNNGQLCGILYTRNWTATDACGNVATAVTTVFVYDNVAPTFDAIVEDMTVECASEIPAFIDLTATDVCSEVSVVRSENVIDGDECGNQIIEVSYVASDACGNQSFTSYLITVLDETAPVLSTLPSDLTIACDATVPAVEEVTATDNCGGAVEVIFEETYVGEQPAEGSIADCDLMTPGLAQGNPCNYPTAWAMALFNMPAAHRYYVVQNGSFVEYPNGTVVINAVLANAYNANAGFNVNVTFANKMDWNTWSSQNFPTSFKADCGGIDANYQDWFYFLLVNGPGAELVGWGDYSGSALNLSHAPSNNYFGFQLGNGANNYNEADNGFGGWFTYSGTFVMSNTSNITNVTGAGDFAFELDCCPDYQVVRCWTAFDCSGNITQHCQTISFEGSDEITVAPTTPESTVEAEPVKETTINVFPNPAVDMTNFVFVASNNGKAMIEIFDLAGARVGLVYATEVVAGNEYRTTFDTQNMATGVYMYRLTNGEKVDMGRLIINR